MQQLRIFAATALLTLTAIPSLAAKQKTIDFTTVPSAYAARERTAPQAIKDKLAGLRSDIASNKLEYQVGYTDALDYDLSDLAGDTAAPGDMERLATHKVIGQQLMDALDAAKADYSKKHPHENVGGYPQKCKASLSAFDFRRVGDVTPVKKQAHCGSCWDFGTVAGMESAERYYNNKTTDQSEEFILYLSGAGSCAGGNHIDALDFYVTHGNIDDSAAPYTQATPPSITDVVRWWNMPAKYKASFWFPVWLTDDAAPPDVLKAAMQAFGPLTVDVTVDPAFQAYAGGVFSSSDTDKTNHCIELIGWDDSKHAWLIKNSWGTNWGSTCGYGSSKGYMWIKYGSNNIGARATAVIAEPLKYHVDSDTVKRIYKANNVEIHDVKPAGQ